MWVNGRAVDFLYVALFSVVRYRVRDFYNYNQYEIL
jgi:hypothetical protein